MKINIIMLFIAVLLFFALAVVISTRENKLGFNKVSYEMSAHILNFEAWQPPTSTPLIVKQLATKNCIKFADGKPICL